MTYAQTNIQLYSRLLEARWSEADLRRLHAAYDLAMRLFAGHFRPNHKPFLAHLVGTASILAEHGVDSGTVTAGLLHSAYSHGEFGDGSRGVTAAKARTMRRAIGDECESIVARYTSIRWQLPEIAAFANAADQLLAIDRTAATIKLADVLEDFGERGMEYSPNKQLFGAPAMREAWRQAYVRLAIALDHDRLAEELVAALAPTDERPIPEFLLGAKPGSFLIPPRSHRMKATVRLGRLLRRWRRQLARQVDRAGRRAAM